MLYVVVVVSLDLPEQREEYGLLEWTTDSVAQKLSEKFKCSAPEATCICTTNNTESTGRKFLSTLSVVTFQQQEETRCA